MAPVQQGPAAAHVLGCPAQQPWCLLVWLHAQQARGQHVAWLAALGCCPAQAPLYQPAPLPPAGAAGRSAHAPPPQRLPLRRRSWAHRSWGCRRHHRHYRRRWLPQPRSSWRCCCGSTARHPACRAAQLLLAVQRRCSRAPPTSRAAESWAPLLPAAVLQVARHLQRVLPPRRWLPAPQQQQLLPPAPDWGRGWWAAAAQRPQVGWKHGQPAAPP